MPSLQSTDRNAWISRQHAIRHFCALLLACVELLLAGATSRGNSPPALCAFQRFRSRLHVPHGALPDGTPLRWPASDPSSNLRRDQGKPLSHGAWPANKAPPAHAGPRPISNAGECHTHLLVLMALVCTGVRESGKPTALLLQIKKQQGPKPHPWNQRLENRTKYEFRRRLTSPRNSSQTDHHALQNTRSLCPLCPASDAFGPVH
mmetsp:Transcript_36661/g.80081  ORF Transcript_36661/g.80081 Transcript_36661/m.80081 type:complete len:205 (-) Transcript_36661:1562-2176(-)